jgi:beta-N-acetylhexosaminidase
MLKRIFVVFLLLMSAASAKDRFQSTGPVQLDRDGDKWAEKTLKKLSLEQKIGQMLMTSAPSEFLNTSSPEYQKLRDMVQHFQLGGVVLTLRTDGLMRLRSQPYEAAAWTNQLQTVSSLPLIIAADFEYGPTMRLAGPTPFPSPMAFGAAGKPENAEAFGRITALESRAMGVQWNFFPIADVNSNPANPIINTRSFGEDPQQVGEMVAAYIRGAHSMGMLTTAKHFPGHGDTSTDSHLALARVDGDQARLDTVELPPFKRAIEAGVDAVMIAHVTVPALEPDPNRVATTSPGIVTGLLKEKLGFQGIVITDALDMNALSRLYSLPGRSAVEAVKAGADVALQPGNLEAAFNALVNAVRSGEIPESQIDASVRKILRAKASLGLHKARQVDIQKLPEIIARPDSIAAGLQVAEHAITLVRDNGQVLPLKKSGTTAPRRTYGDVREPGNRLLALILTDDMRSDGGRVLERELRARIPDVNVIYVDPRVASALSQNILTAVAGAQAIIVAAYVTPTSGKVVKVNGEYINTVSLEPGMATLFKSVLQSAPAKTVVLAMGSPYLAQDFPEVQTYVCTFSNQPISELSVAKALFGEIAIHGHLPVTIPNVAARGSGVERNAQVLAGGFNVSGSKTAAR